MNQLFGLQHRNRVRCAFDFILSKNIPAIYGVAGIIRVMTKLIPIPAGWVCRAIRPSTWR